MICPWPSEIGECMEKPKVAALVWNQQTRSLMKSMRSSNSSGVSSVDMGRETPFGFFDESWYGPEGGYRWTRAESSVHLTRSAKARGFAVRVNVSPVQLREQGEVGLEVLIDGRSAGVRKYKAAAWTEQTWPLPPGGPGEVTVTLRAVKPFRPSNGDPRVLGVAVGSMGFVE